MEGSVLKNKVLPFQNLQYLPNFQLRKFDGVPFKSWTGYNEPKRRGDPYEFKKKMDSHEKGGELTLELDATKKLSALIASKKKTS